MQERGGRIEDASKVFDEMPMRTVPKNAKVLLLDEASGVQDTIERMLRRCAGWSRAVREERQCGGCERICTGAAGPHVENVGGRRGEGNGRSPAALWTAREEFGGGQVRANLDSSGGG
jgi:hypothetical protein